MTSSAAGKPGILFSMSARLAKRRLPMRNGGRLTLSSAQTVLSATAKKELATAHWQEIWNLNQPISRILSAFTIAQTTYYGITWRTELNGRECLTFWASKTKRRT